jgi:hypothetical protein
MASRHRVPMPGTPSDYLTRARTRIAREAMASPGWKCRYAQIFSSVSKRTTLTLLCLSRNRANALTYGLLLQAPREVIGVSEEKADIGCSHVFVLFVDNGSLGRRVRDLNR